MSMPTLKIWYGPSETRVYVNARYADYRNGMNYADGSYFAADENGKIKVWFQPSMSGIHGNATRYVMEWLGITRQTDFAIFVDCVKRGVGPRGGFNINRFHECMENV